MTSSNKEQEIMKARIEAAAIDALQRYPDMPEVMRQYVAEYLLCGVAGGIPRSEVSSYRWLLPLHPNVITPSINTHDWSYYLRQYSRHSGYVETPTNET